MSVSDIAAQLTRALEDAQKAHVELEKAKAALAPLEAAATEKDEAVTKLMLLYQEHTGTAPATRRRSSRGGARPRTPEQNVKIQEQKARTLATKQGLKPKEIEAAVKAAGTKAAQKLGLPYPLPK